MTEDKIARQRLAQRRAEPILRRAMRQMLEHGLTPAEAAQAMILTGAGALARALGPDGAGHALRDVATKQATWLTEIAETVEARLN
jgi:hypothetical protein